ncbi:TIGR04255 family protein [Methylomicrobium sp. Wu6]|uniref:TIGR04255 family protein n=1 Tax=Methylomicrobium sp. Wu6 TaxID=3107928 RepID=UPI002DD61DE8|nr:TIGR04255 family protein [Methylomicrobium sp. Wu6]MEC4749568.1 TIGR04255 family protein [Methylomicrobium sp. Wu6]
MTSSWNADSLVTIRSENVDQYKRNFLHQAVCELRFPTLMELGEPRPPAAFVKALRKEYPHLELANEVSLRIGGNSSNNTHTHIFRSAKLTWTVSLKQSALSVETTAYSDYAHMRERVLGIVEAASKIIDSDFFTRIGLRYINIIDSDTNPVLGWVNPELVGPLLSGCFKGIHEYAGKLQLMTDDGGCLLQHGIVLKQKQAAGETIPQYLLDIDVFRNEIQLSNTGEALDAMHAQVFDVFDWAIGPKAREYLSTESSQKRA